MAGDAAFSGKVAVVTGGSSGIGFSVGLGLARRGARVWLVARHRQALESARDEIISFSGCDADLVRIIPTDVSDPDQAFDCINKIEDDEKRVDYLFNVAGFVHPGYVQDLELDLFHKMMDVNYFGTVYTTKAVLPGMIQRHSGHIVNVASLGAVVAYIGYSAYAPSKFAVRGFTDALRTEMKAHNVRVSIVYPGDTDTPQLEYENQHKPLETKYIGGVGRIYSPGEVANSILEHVRRGRYVIVPGTRMRLLYRAITLVGEGVNPIIDFLISQSRKNME
ncbi:MAG: SDR family oxidoreductase [Anaerolineales bacterium]